MYENLNVKNEQIVNQNQTASVTTFENDTLQFGVPNDHSPFSREINTSDLIRNGSKASVSTGCFQDQFKAGAKEQKPQVVDGSNPYQDSFETDESGM